MRQISSNARPSIGSGFSADAVPTARPTAYSILGITIVVYGMYISLATLVLGLLAGGVLTGINIIVYHSFGLATLGGIGLIIISGGGLLLVSHFFLFAQPRSNQHHFAVTSEEQPHLFKLIEQLTKATGARRPSAVFLSPEVEVSIQYPASFFGLLLPYPKDLVIGLGLVNSLTMSEFEAVLTHELHRTPQHGFKPGSYVYAIHCVLYNLAHARSHEDEWLDAQTTKPGPRGKITQATRWLREQGQGLLRKIYWLGGNQYQQAAHQTVYKADQQTARLLGDATLVSALRSVAFGEWTYAACSEHLNQLAKRAQMPEDMYRSHRTVLVQLAAELKLPLVNHLPRVSAEVLRKYGKLSRINDNHPGQSRPPLADRESAVPAVTGAEKPNTRSAWRLLKNASILRGAMTQQLYSLGFPGKKFQGLSPDAFAHFLQEKAGQRQLSSEYHGFYDQRFLYSFDPSALAASNEPIDQRITFDMIYNESNRAEIASFLANQAALAVLKQKQVELPGGSFEFDGVRYRPQSVGKLLSKLSHELAHQNRWLSELDRFAFLLHLRQAREAEVSCEYVARCQALMRLQKAYQHFLDSQEQIAYWQDQLSQRPWWTDEETSALVIELATIEASFKSQLQACAELVNLGGALSKSMQKDLIFYLHSKEKYYLNVTKFDKKSFAYFTKLVSEVTIATDQAYRQSLRSVTNYQLGLQEAQREVHQQ